MRCPFLREAQVKFCRASAHRKMIVRLSEQPANERCSSPDYVNCPAAKQHAEERPSVDHCPFLHESLVQYCTAAPVTKYIPYTESVLSQCGTDSHSYCDLYLALAQPGECGVEAAAGCAANSSSIKAPKELYFAPNHMWLELAADGTCHIGLDAFITGVLGAPEHLTFISGIGTHRPAVSISIHGVDLQLVFPKPLTITRANTYLRTNPSKMVNDPYKSGWLFEATMDRSAQRSTLTEGLITGDAISPWMQNEMDRMSRFAHHAAARPDHKGQVMMADGGSYGLGFAQYLSREELLKLYTQFYSPLIHWNIPQ